MIRLTKHELAGVNYSRAHFDGEHNGVICLGDERIILKGTPQINLMTGSYKFKEELQFRIFCPKNTALSVIKEKRNASSWNTFDINLPISELQNVIDSLLLLQREYEKVKK